MDGTRPAVDLEDAALVGRLFALFHGAPEGGGPGAPEAERPTPAAPALQARLMGVFMRSLAAANAFPAVLQARPPRPPRRPVQKKGRAGTVRSWAFFTCCRLYVNRRHGPMSGQAQTALCRMRVPSEFEQPLLLRNFLLPMRLFAGASDVLPCCDTS